MHGPRFSRVNLEWTGQHIVNAEMICSLLWQLQFSAKHQRRHYIIVAVRHRDLVGSVKGGAPTDCLLSAAFFFGLLLCAQP